MLIQNLTMDASILVFFILVAICCVQADIYIYKNSEIYTKVFQDLLSRYGPGLPFKGLSGHLRAADPLDACSPVALADGDDNLFAIVKRYNCTFEKKVRNVQAANYSAVIIFNINSDELEQISYENSTDINIPAIFVGEDTGFFLLQNTEDTFVVLCEGFNIYSGIVYVFLTIVVLSATYIIWNIVAIWIRSNRRRRRLQRYLLPVSALKNIPKLKYEKKYQKFKTCAICQDNFVIEEIMRILPCSHAYHSKCIDVWLTKYRRVCPICKRRLLLPGETDVRFDSDSDGEEPNDQTPLLTSVNLLNSGGGTFQSIRERLGFGRSTFQDGASTSTSRNVTIIRSVNSAPIEYDDDSYCSISDSGGEDTSSSTVPLLHDADSADITRSELSAQSSDQRGNNDQSSATSGKINV